MLWDTNARINGLVATDLETLVSEVLSPFPRNAGFADGLFVMTTATDHKNNLNRSVLKKDYARTLRVETIANSAGGTARAMGFQIDIARCELGMTERRLR